MEGRNTKQPNRVDGEELAHQIEDESHEERPNDYKHLILARCSSLEELGEEVGKNDP